LREGRWVVVGDDHRGLGRKGHKQALPLTLRGLDVRKVANASGFSGLCIVGHALQHEGVEAIAGPPVVATQRLDDQQREVQTRCPPGGPLHCEAVFTSSAGGYPVQDVTAADGREIDHDPQARRGHFGNRVHELPLCS
jgi:hypothetical protein